MFDGQSQEIEAYFADRGFPRPSNYSTTDWVMEVSMENSKALLHERGFYETQESEESEFEFPEPLDISFSAGADRRVPLENEQKHVAIVTEMKELFTRELLVFLRNPLPRMKEVGMIGVLSLLIGVVFGGVGKHSLDDPEAFASHVGVVFTVIFSCAIIAMTSISSTVNNRSRFCREYISGHYRILSYGIVMALFELGFILICGVVYTTTVYWTVDFNSHLLHFLGLVLAYGAISSALGFAFTSLFDVADHAQSHVPLVVFPQLLLSGFLATPHSLSSWIRWMIWLQPLTYSYRLMLNEEFAVCQDMSEDHRLHLNCFQAMQAGLQAAQAGNPEEVYTDDSKLTVMQGGQYEGARAIMEYFSFFSGEQAPLSLLWDHCAVSHQFNSHFGQRASHSLTSSYLLSNSA